MSQKYECPACHAYLSGVWDALQGGREACPSCGLPGRTMREVEQARTARADADLTAKYEQAVIRAGKAEAELAKLRSRLYPVRQIIEELARDELLDSPEWEKASWP